MTPDQLDKLTAWMRPQPMYAEPLRAIEWLMANHASASRMLTQQVEAAEREYERAALAEAQLAEREARLAEADAVIADGLEEAQYRDHILSPEEYERFEKAALARYAARLSTPSGSESGG